MHVATGPCFGLRYATIKTANGYVLRKLYFHSATIMVLCNLTNNVTMCYLQQCNFMERSVVLGAILSQSVLREIPIPTEILLILQLYKISV